ncbi:AcrR family transcriptional regulator [Arthrobacter silviterrae]|uniref:TetR/AcrR family transcriptional regulator n=1 Tax=Arthrobacter silviterrae TaxID=2026658 RepID=A0ABX0DG26_9MICC|nr:TetR/AcrR family transcriptional regulator [Arthrobacter silviterrae]MDQ0279318.1 AcrR family transcriptional regulator [Arthrobacter silviterrae]NGN83480.1 TetR/AcrR family transcriptional regulator [Arthrobacter silviterrae]
MKQRYVMSVRADAFRQTGERILAAAYARFKVALFDEVTLDQIAADAEVTVQTVIRRFGSKAGIVAELTRIREAQVDAHRRDAPVGNLAGAVANLIEFYEAEGDLMMHLLRQESRVRAFAEIAEHGRKVHVEWCARVFASGLEARSGVARKRLAAQLVAICDLYTWHLLRRQQRLSQRQTKLALMELLEGALS